MGSKNLNAKDQTEAEARAAGREDRVRLFEPKLKAGRLEIVDALRGLAALAVCLDHFLGLRPTFWSREVNTATAAYCCHGVDVFFVISGFVIPYSLYRSHFKLGDYGRYLLKRIVRLEPPYLASVALILLVDVVAPHFPGFRGQPVTYSFARIALNVGYLNVFFGSKWLNPVCWTLAIEVQYYLAVGLLFALISGRSRAGRIATAVVLGAAAAELPNRVFLPCWFFVFLLGITAFQLIAGVIRHREFAILTCVFTVGACCLNGPVVATTSLATALLIAFYRGKISWPLLFLGQISYSLYLTHLLVGTRINNFLSRWPLNFSEKSSIFALDLAASIGFAWLFWRFIEQPALRWASKIKFRSAKVDSVIQPIRAT